MMMIIGTTANRTDFRYQRASEHGTRPVAYGSCVDRGSIERVGHFECASRERWWLNFRSAETQVYLMYHDMCKMRSVLYRRLMTKDGHEVR